MPENNQLQSSQNNMEAGIAWDESFKDLNRLYREGLIQEDIYMRISSLHDMIIGIMRSERETGQSQTDTLTLRVLRQAYAHVDKLCDEYLVSHEPDGPGYSTLQSVSLEIHAERENLENYNPGLSLTLQDIFNSEKSRERNRTEELDLSRRVGQAMSARIPAKANGKNGYFTPEEEGKKQEKFYNALKAGTNLEDDQKAEYDELFRIISTPAGIAGFTEMIHVPGWSEIVTNFTYGEEEAEKAPFRARMAEALRKAGASEDIISQYLSREDVSDAYQQLIAAYNKELIGVAFNYKYAGIAGNANIERRNAATSKVGDLIGMTDLMAYSTTMTAVIDGREVKGVFMEEARGYTTPELKKKVEQFDGVDYNEEELIKQVSDIQALDYICGSTDRHDKNVIFQFDEDQKKIIGVKGIDNDMSFGTLSPESLDQGKRYMAGPDNMLLLRQSTADRILGLSREELENSLKGLIEPDEIESAWKRTEVLQNRILESMKREADAKRSPGDDLSMGQLKILKDDDPFWKKLNFSQLGQLAGEKSLFGQISKIKLFEKAPHQPDILNGRPRANVLICTTETDEKINVGLLSSNSIAAVHQYARSGLDQSYPETYSPSFSKTYFSFHIRPFMDEKIFETSLYKDLGIRNITDCIYCDGKNVRDFLQEKYGIAAEIDGYTLETRIGELALSGKHQLSLVNIQTDRNGKEFVNISDIKVDFKAIDPYCDHLSEKPGEMGKRLDKTADETRENRFANIEEDVLEKYRQKLGRELGSGSPVLSPETVRKNKLGAGMERSILQYNSRMSADRRIESNLQRLLLHPEAISGYMEMFETKHTARILRWNSGTYNDTLSAMKDYQTNAEAVREMVVKLSEETDPQKIAARQSEIRRKLEQTKESYERCRELLPKYVQKVLGNDGKAVNKSTGTGFARAAGAQGLESEFLKPSIERNDRPAQKSNSHNRSTAELTSFKRLFEEEMTGLKGKGASNKHRKAARAALDSAKQAKKEQSKKR